ncbi:hypothetical protein FDK38_003699 [Candidozyma auris]|nr:hypothetical protein FDK38_003699 [[Candida] auris]
MARACVTCKHKKLKCDGERPACGRCCKLGLPCEIPRDKRSDKRKVENGTSSFVFKNTGRKGRKGGWDKPVAFDDNELSSAPPLEASFGGEFVRGSLLEPTTLAWPELDEVELPYDLDIEEFLHSLDYPLGLETTEPVGEITSAFTGFSPVGEDQPTPYHVLIDTVFSDASHTPVSITKAMITGIADKADRSEDESFLLSIVLAIGALTLAKQKYAEQRKSILKLGTDASDPSYHIKTPLVANEALNHYQEARKLNSHILENPSAHGFRGLVLISNFLSGLLTLEAQMFISFHALQVAVAIKMHTNKETGSSEEESGLKIAFWELWCSACLFASFHGRLPPVRREEITTSLEFDLKNEYNKRFFHLRVEIAELHCQVAALKVNGVASSVSEIDFHTKVSTISRRIVELEALFPQTESNFYRQELLTLELKCWMSQAIMLEGHQRLTRKLSIKSVVEARKLIRELWSYYNPEKFARGTMLSHLDWNFTYPLRTATMCAFTAAKTLTLFINSVDYLTFDFFDYCLSKKVLKFLTGVMSINKHLLQDLDNYALK